MIMWEIGAAEDSRPSDIEVSGSDIEELLVNFLEEFLYLYDAKRLVCTKIEVTEFSDQKIRGRAWLQLFNAQQDEELLNVKAVTYHQLSIGRAGDGWQARVFLDI